MNKYLRVTMNDGTRWDVPAEVIAQNRAKYYAEIDPTTTLEEEYSYAMEDDGELMDWAANNMNWEDVEKYAVRAPDAPKEAPDYQEGWVNGEKEIVTK